jgi:uncharacterized protein (DUF2147 family)
MFKIPRLRISYLTCLLFCSIFGSVSSAGAQEADSIVGTWLSANQGTKLTFYKEGTTYSGKIAWLKDGEEHGEARKDVNNPDESKRSRPLVGMEMFTGFEYRRNIWTRGKMYDPKTGNTYNCQLRLVSPDKLNIRVFFGINFLGKTETWTRVSGEQ